MHVLALNEISRRFGRHPRWTGLIVFAGMLQTAATIVFAGLLAHVLYALIITGLPFDDVRTDWWLIQACIVIRALAGAAPQEDFNALGVLETFSAASIVLAADAAAKAAAVTILDIHLAMGLGGKGYAYMTGDVAAVQAVPAVQIRIPCRAAVGDEIGAQ